LPKAHRRSSAESAIKNTKAATIREGLLNFRQHSSRRQFGLDPRRAVLVAHERIVSIDLAGKSRPALGEISQNLGLSFIL